MYLFQLIFLGELYLTGGIGMTNNTVNQMSGKHMSTVSCYSVNSDTWRPVASMNTHRSSHVTISHGNYSLICILYIYTLRN